MATLPNPQSLGGLEYMVTAVFSAVAAVFSWLARRSGRHNTRSLEEVKRQTNGELMDKIRLAVTEAVTHDELVQAVSEEAIRDYLNAVLVAHLESDTTGRALFDDVFGITERRQRNDGQ